MAHRPFHWSLAIGQGAIAPVLTMSLLVAALQAYTHKLRDVELEWYLNGTNLGNAEARPFQSTLKYLAPLPGRAVAVGLRASF